MKPGELCYCRESSCLTRRFTWQQSLDSRLTEDSKEALFVAEILDGMSDDFARQIQQRLTSGNFMFSKSLFIFEVYNSFLMLKLNLQCYIKIMSATLSTFATGIKFLLISIMTNYFCFFYY